MAPTPAPAGGAVSAKASPTPVQSLFELQAMIRQRMDRPELRRGQIGIKIVTLNDEKVIFEENSEKYFMPASNMKNFTVAAALEKLTPDFRFVTSVFASKPPDENGTIVGDLTIYGRGDISFSSHFSPGDPLKGLDDLANKILAAGVKRIEGSIVGDDSYFRGSAIPGSWEWDDLQWYYGAEVSALSVNDNVVELTVKPGPVGYSCSVKLSPVNPIYRVRNNCATTPAGSQRTLKIEKLLGQNQLEITGNLPVGNSGFTGSVTVTRPAEMFAALLKQRLEARGVFISGRFSVSANAAAHNGAARVEIATLESPPLSLIAAKTMKPSQNNYTETLLWTLGEFARSRTQFPTVGPADTPSQQDSARLGIGEVKAFLTGIGISEDSLIQHDGSGLSRHNLITPSSVARLYVYMAKQSKVAQPWRDSLTIGGVDGTLANRFKGTSAEGNIRGKTGTINQVSALSGYLTTAGGEQLVISFVVNGVPLTRDRTSMIDDIVVMLAKFNGELK
ncbi:MAG TPA: D-alanyl-D-alanine carboxypeptidase/D-alanyl-D-alanine-endopeptidase [Pyrinomonadaceae bacterium]|nr:D-alanyl-D-alanine carboxypeptidase/D-alanyl-D-alanine-endopeptidase [Pyrinomonadaceae bacterium]